MPLLKFFIRRAVHSLPMLFGLATVVFFLSRLLPGDPASLFIAPGVPPDLAEQLRTQFGLHRPLGEQYLLWLTAVARGDLGFSFTHHASVVDVLRTVFPNTAILGLSALALELVLALLIALTATANSGSWFDRVISNATLVVYTLPSFWLGIILLSVFSFGVNMFPSSQMYSSGEGGRSAADVVHHLVLPALTVAIPGAAGLARYLRTSISNTLTQDYVLAARSMGLSRKRIVTSYVLPNSLGPTVSMLGIEIGVLLTGVLVTETLFAWPGMGRIAVMAIFARDYPLILGCTLVAGVVVIAGNVIADLVNALIDPRIRLT